MIFSVPVPSFHRTGCCRRRLLNSVTKTHLSKATFYGINVQHFKLGFKYLVLVVTPNCIFEWLLLVNALYISDIVVVVVITVVAVIIIIVVVVIIIIITSYLCL